MTSLAANWRIVALGMMLSTMTTVTFYMITAYTPTFGQTALHLANVDNLTVTMCVGLSNLFWLPVMGALSDRVGRRRSADRVLGALAASPHIRRCCGW